MLPIFISSSMLGVGSMQHATDCASFSAASHPARAAAPVATVWQVRRQPFDRRSFSPRGQIERTCKWNTECDGVTRSTEVDAEEKLAAQRNKSSGNSELAITSAHA